MAAENSILQARIKGLQNAVVIEKKRRKRGKPCIKNIRTINEGKATFWSPTKLGTTKQAIRDEEATKQQIALEKAQAKILLVSPGILTRVGQNRSQPVFAS